MPDKTMVTYFHSFADKRMRLDPGMISDSAILLDLYKRADKTMVAYPATV
jgi:hypothetical protein